MVSKIRLAKIVKVINSVHLPNWLILVLALTLVLRIPSFFEPYSYGDETTYLTLGESIREGKILYKDIFDHKPPLLYFIAAAAGNLFWFKAILAFWSLVTIVLFWKLTVALFADKPKLQKAAIIIFALLTTLPLLEGNIANAENFMIGLSIAGFLILLTKTLNFRNIFFAGVLFSLATLFKVPALFDTPVIVFYWLITSNLREIKKISLRTLYLGIGFLFPILLTFIWYALRGAFDDFFKWGFLINFTYISAYRPSDADLPFIQKNLPLIIRGLLVLAGVFLTYLARRKISNQFVFLTIWLFFTLFAITLPERPYPHYILQAAAPLSILVAMLFTLGTIEQTLVILPLTVFFVVPVYYKFWYYSTSAYYQRFLEFAQGRVSKDQYLSNFGSHIPRSYKIAEFVMGITSGKDEVFVWGPESQTVYALSRTTPPIRFVANFHIRDYSSQEEVFKILLNKKPKLIVLLPNSANFPELNAMLDETYVLADQVDGAEVWLLATNKLNWRNF